MLQDFIAAHPGERVTLADLRNALGDRAFGMLMFVFALPNLIPGGIPIISTVLGIPLVLLAAQLVYGRPRPWFPRVLLDRSFSKADFAKVIRWAVPYLERAERLLKPRLSVLVSWTGERVIGGICLVLAIVLSLPIPLGNWLPGLALCLFGLALVEKDGAAAVAGAVVGVVSILVVWGVIIAFISAAVFFIAQFVS